MGEEDKDYITLFIQVTLREWMAFKIGDQYNYQVEGILLVGEVIGKNPGELVVRFKKPRNVA